MENFYYDRDPLRLELLPEGWEKEPTALSFRSRATRGRSYRNPFTSYVLTFAAVVALAVVFGLRVVFCDLSRMGQMVFSWQAGVLVLGLIVADALPSFMADARPSYWIGRALIPVGVWLALVCLVQPTWVLLVLLFVTSVLFADALAANYAAWLLADLTSDFDFRTELRARWQARFGRENWLASLFVLFREEDRPRLVDTYPAGFLLFGVATVLALLSLFQLRGLTAGLVTLLMLTAWLACQGTLLHRWAGIRKVSFRLRTAVTARAFDTWLNYNPRNVQAPGLHQSPYGRSELRLGLLAAAVGLTSAALTLLTAYYPVLMLGPEGDGPWAQQLAWRRAVAAYDQAHGRAGESVFWRWLSADEFYGPSGGPSPKTPAEFSAVEAKLTPAERLYYDQITDPATRAAYLTRVAKIPPVQSPEVIRARLGDFGLVRSSPESWLLANYLGAWTGKKPFVLSFVLTLLLGVAVPPLFLGLVVWALVGPELALMEARLTHRLAQQHPRGSQPEESPAWYNPEWLGYVEAVQGSANEQERQHLFLGFAQAFDTDDELPVFCHRGLLGDHVHITGSSGAGKTSRGLAPLASQLVRFARGGATHPGDCSVLVIDLKGDDSLFHGLRHEAAGMPFRWYRDQRGTSSFGFNPILQSHLAYFDPAQKARTVMDAFGLRFGDSFGERYFADIQESVLRRVFEQHPGIRSLREMHAVLCAPDAHATLCPEMPARDWEHGFHVREQLGAFARCLPLNEQTEDAARRIDMPSLFVYPQVVYFYVPALFGGGANVQAAKFALYSLLTSAMFIRKEDRIPVYCLIDEFQEVSGRNIGVILRQARQFDVGLVLCNQLATDLDQGATRMQETVTGNVALSWAFRPGTAAERQTLLENSGEYIETMRNFSVTRQFDEKGQYTGENLGTTYSQQFRPAFSRNRILWAGFRGDLSIAHFHEGKGYTQFFRPFAMRTLFHISQKLYDRRMREHWPELPWAAEDRDREARPSVPPPKAGGEIVGPGRQDLTR